MIESFSFSHPNSQFLILKKKRHVNKKIKNKKRRGEGGKMESYPTTLPVIDELIGERIAWLALHDIGLGSLVGQRDGRHLSDGA